MSDLLSSISSPMLDITSKANYDGKKEKETGLMERSIMKGLLVAAAPLSAVLCAIIGYRCTCEHYGRVVSPPKQQVSLESTWWHNCCIVVWCWGTRCVFNEPPIHPLMREFITYTKADLHTLRCEEYNHVYNKLNWGTCLASSALHAPLQKSPN